MTLPDANRTAAAGGRSTESMPTARARETSVPREGLGNRPTVIAAPSEPSMDFGALRLAQVRLARGTREEMRSPAAEAGAMARVLAEAGRDARVARVVKLLELVSGYFNGDAASTREEVAFIEGLTDSELVEVSAAYECAATHVRIMTSDSHAQKAALATSKALNTYYARNGTTEDDLDAVRAETLRVHAPKIRRQGARGY